jgi:hypothetical protein
MEHGAFCMDQGTWIADQGTPEFLLYKFYTNQRHDEKYFSNGVPLYL